MVISWFTLISPMIKPLQNKKAKKNWGTREKSSTFIRKKTAFFSGTPNFFGPSYFEAALVRKYGHEKKRSSWL